MNDCQFQRIRNGFDRYVERFRSDDPDVQRNVDLKKDHSLRVMAEAGALARALGLDAQQTGWARVMGLVHDLGRFEQYRRYHTFVDARSTDHAVLSLKVLRTEPILNGHPPHWVACVEKAVAYHNRYHLPDTENPTVLFYSRLLRDADKLDIFRVVTDYYHRRSGPRNPAIELDLPDTPEASPEVLDDLRRGRSVDKRHIRTLNDFKLLQVGWVHDINFSHTCRQICQRGILDQMAAVLPQTPPFATAIDAARDRMADRAARPDEPGCERIPPACPSEARVPS